MRSGFFLLLVVLALTALAALLWWRFRGSGQPATSAVRPATRNHRSLRTRHYEPANPVQAAEALGSANALDRLLPPEDVDAPEFSVAEAEALQPVAANPPEPAAAPDDSTEGQSRPASSRHAAGAVASLLDALDRNPEYVAITALTEGALEPETDEEPAESLFHNPLTAPAPTANDQANRVAEIALRQQRRARMSAGAATQRTALRSYSPAPAAPGRQLNPLNCLTCFSGR